MRFLILFLLFSTTAFAQVDTVSVGIDGLTCSMCSNSVERSIRQLKFVEKVKMDLNENAAELYIPENMRADYFAVAKKVEDAGYSVRFLYTYLNFPTTAVSEGAIITINGQEYRWVNVSERTITGKTKVRLIGKHFVPKKDLAFWTNILHPYQKIDKSKSIYYITL